jgi:small subunit ribosomal protein S6
MSRYYELTFIAKPDIEEANLNTLMEKVTGFVTSEGGKILKVNHWGVRRLMYPIRKYRDGRYVFMWLELGPAMVARIEGRLKLTEDIIRYLLIRADDDLDISKIVAAPAEAEAAPLPPAPESAPAPEPAPEPPVESAPTA